MAHHFYVTTSRGLEEILQAEIYALGAHVVRPAPGGCRVRGPLGFGYRMCMWSRCASRVLLALGEVVASTPDELYAQVRARAWEDHIDPKGTVAVRFTGSGAGISHVHYGAQRLKDAIVDRLRDRTGRRPDVDRDTPDVRIHAFARGRGCALFVDLAGRGLHRRGYRDQTVSAPLRETLAAALLLRGQWPEVAQAGGALVDPLCGGGTIAIEAAMIAADLAPGARRDYYGFLGWRGHQPDLWREIVDEAEARGVAGRAAIRSSIVGRDRDSQAIGYARAQAERAGVLDLVDLLCGDLKDARAVGRDPGLMATNPPYGDRLGDRASAQRTMAELGDVLRARFVGWRAAVIMPEDVSSAVMGFVPASRTPVSNAQIEARIDAFTVCSSQEGVGVSSDFSRRLAKNFKRLRRWTNTDGVTCFRVYDADIPEYNVAVDLYGDAAVVAEYEAPDDIEPEVAQARFDTAIVAVPEVLGIAPDRVYQKRRRRQRGDAQYNRHTEEGVVAVVSEGGRRFEVNLSGYLDTGLFLDHRPTRARIAELAPGRRFLNLFCYTATATVYAATAGATSSTSVDLSQTYLRWAQKNFDLNRIRGRAHELVRADVRTWLAQETRQFDLVFCDPPTFSNSKAMSDTFDVQRDQVALITAVMERLTPEGVLIFSTNARRFKIDPTLMDRFAGEDRSAATLPLDFARTPRVHRCFEFRHRLALPVAVHSGG